MCARGPPSLYNREVATEPEESDSESENSDDSVYTGRPTRWTKEQTIGLVSKPHRSECFLKFVIQIPSVSYTDCRRTAQGRGTREDRRTRQGNPLHVGV
jgi:hypothetical protein